jgi:hypothetical protein
MKTRRKQHRILWVRPDKKTSGVLFPGPLGHKEALACLRSLTRYPWRLEILQPIA